MDKSFVMCTRKEKDGVFTSKPGEAQFLLVPPDAETYLPKHAEKAVKQKGKGNEKEHAEGRDAWFRKLSRAAVWGRDLRRPDERPDELRAGRGDILVFIHGYNNDPAAILRRHRRLDADLKTAGFRGAVMSFDWPSANLPLNYIEDRHDAKQTALRLVDEAIMVLARDQTTDCAINIHLIGHSTGAYVIREAFDDADDTNLHSSAWMVSQIVFIGADVSADSLNSGNSSSDSLYRHCTRLTNYSNHRDKVLKLSNAKRIGMSPRVGRVGLPFGAPGKAVNVDCTAYFAKLDGSAPMKVRDQRDRIGAFDHSWHIGNRVFAQDLFETLRGDLDRSAIPTRRRGEDGRLELSTMA